MPEPGVDDIAGQVGEASTRLGAIEQLDVGQPPLPLRVNQLTLRPGAGGRPRDKQVALMFQAEVDARLQLVEERDALPDQLHLLRVVELQPEGTGRHRRGERGQRGPFLDDDRAKAGALGEVGGRAADHAPADDDEVGGLGR